MQETQHAAWPATGGEELFGETQFQSCAQARTTKEKKAELYSSLVHTT